MTLTIEQFRASRQRSEDLLTDACSFYADSRDGQKWGGWTYLDGQLHIEDPNTWPKRDGLTNGEEAYAILGNQEIAGTLAEVEQEIFEFARDDGYTA